LWSVSSLHGYAHNIYHTGYASQGNAYCHMILSYEWHIHFHFGATQLLNSASGINE
jgi:hypothetical protein